MWAVKLIIIRHGIVGCQFKGGANFAIIILKHKVSNSILAASTHMRRTAKQINKNNMKQVRVQTPKKNNLRLLGQSRSPSSSPMLKSLSV